MKMRHRFIIVIILLLIAAIFYFFLVIKNKELISTDLNDIIRVCVTEYKTKAIITEDKDTIANILNYLQSLERHVTLNPLDKHENWSLRIAMYGSFDEESRIIKEGFYITKDGKVYKGFLTYHLVGFDYDYFLSLLK